MYTNADLPEPNEPPQEIDAELRRLLAWLIHNNKAIAQAKGAKEVVIAPHDWDRPPELKSEKLGFSAWYVR